MADWEVRVLQSDRDYLARNLEIRLGSKKVATPSRALGASRSSAGDLGLLSYNEFRSLATFAEVFSSVSIGKLESCLEDNGERLRYESEVDRVLQRAQGNGQLPYLMISVQDNRGDPLNGLPSDQQVDYLLDLLWRPTNALVLTPLFGNLRTAKDYLLLISRINDRRDTIDVKPIAVTIPSVYRALTKTVIEECWKAGIRTFALDLEGRSMGAQGTVITLVNITLGSLSKDAEEPYVLLALNVKNHIGTGEFARLHNLMGHAYGFDAVGLNRIRHKGWSATKPKRTTLLDSIRFLQSRDYGYLNATEMSRIRKQGREAEFDTPPLVDLTPETLRKKEPDFVRQAARLHNAVKDQREERTYRRRIESGDLGSYLDRKRRIQSDLAIVKRLVVAARTQTQMKED